MSSSALPGMGARCGEIIAIASHVNRCPLRVEQCFDRDETGSPNSDPPVPMASHRLATPSARANRMPSDRKFCPDRPRHWRLLFATADVGYENIDIPRGSYHEAGGFPLAIVIILKVEIPSRYAHLIYSYAGRRETAVRCGIAGKPEADRPAARRRLYLPPRPQAWRPGIASIVTCRISRRR
ncbi:MAG TPA: hypothetical protein VND94_15905 [Terriglobia bacterium]|nr:hypothetical protein [Terriglobia bacterium]